MSRLPARRLVAAGAAALFAALATAVSAAPASAAEEPYPVGVRAVHSVQLNSWVDGQAYDRDLGTSVETRGPAAASVTSANWPLAPLPDPPPWVWCVVGCGYPDGAGRASALATGVLRTAARAHAGASGTYAAEAFASGTASLQDTITLSKPATVVVRGRFRARASEQAEPGTTTRPVVSAEVRLGTCPQTQCYPPRWASSRIGAATVDEPFELAVPLPAGRSPLLANLSTQARVTARAPTAARGLTGGWSEADAIDSDGDVDLLELAVHVPDDVVVRSGSDRLTIVGGQRPGPDADWTPPVLSVPDTIVADPTGRFTSVPFTATATDDRGSAAVRCDPSGPYFIGVTHDVWCEATDAAGNVGHASFKVRIRSTAEILAGLRGQVDQLPTYPRDRLRAVFPGPVCGEVVTFNQRVSQLVVALRLTLDQGKALIATTERVRTALACK